MLICFVFTYTHGYSFLSSRQSVLPGNFNPEELGEDKEYLKARKKRRGTVSNIWQLQAVLNDEIDEDTDFIANATDAMIEEEIEEEDEGEEEELQEESTQEADDMPQQDVYAEDGLYTTHL